MCSSSGIFLLLDVNMPLRRKCESIPFERRGVRWSGEVFGRRCTVPVPFKSGLMVLFYPFTFFRKRLERALGSSCLPVVLMSFIFYFAVSAQTPSGEGVEQGGALIPRSEPLATLAENACVRERVRADDEKLQGRSSARLSARVARPYPCPVDTAKNFWYTMTQRKDTKHEC